MVSTLRFVTRFRIHELFEEICACSRYVVDVKPCFAQDVYTAAGRVAALSALCCNSVLGFGLQIVKDSITQDSFS